MVRRLATYAGRNFIALLALFVALGGTSYAVAKLPRNSVGTKQLKKNAVISNKVKDRSLLARDFRRGQLPAGPIGPRGPAGVQGATGAQGPKGDPQYKRTVLVSPVGTAQENGTALRNALASITDASKDNQYLLKIEPGRYDVGTTAITMKTWVDVEGSGLNRTIILGAVDGGVYTSGLIIGAAGSELRWLSVANEVAQGLGIGVLAPTLSGRPPFIVERVQIFVGADIAIGAYERGGILQIDGSTIFAFANSGATHFAFGIDAEPANISNPTLGLSNSYVSATDGSSSNIALQMTRGTGKITHSELHGATAAIALNYPGQQIGADTLLVATSEVDGPTTLTNGAKVKCVYAYKGNFDPIVSAATCT